MRIYLYSGYILKTEPTTFADRLYVRKREESRITPSCFGLRTWKDEIAIY